MSLTTIEPQAQLEPHITVDQAVLSQIVAGFEPETIGVPHAWAELYLACQAADASHNLLRAIHDVKEAAEDAQALRGDKVPLPFSVVNELRDQGPALRIIALQYRQAGHALAANALETATDQIKESLPDLF
ncbi:MAG: hypothetical protein L6Q57_02290 [Alphaproteobacteria bacterium]|nr:hypothetical protein [Alphaproteobacteria bacterium]